MTYNNRYLEKDLFLNADITRGISKKKASAKYRLSIIALIILLILFLILSGKPQAKYYVDRNGSSFNDVKLSDKVSPFLDGDTIRVNIANVHNLLGSNISIRIADIDTPEMKSDNLCERKLAIAARNFTEVNLSTAKRIDLTNCKRGKYFRLVCNVIYDGHNLATKLLDKRLAVKYNGKTKTIWCNE